MAEPNGAAAAPIENNAEEEKKPSKSALKKAQAKAEKAARRAENATKSAAEKTSMPLRPKEPKPPNPAQAAMDIDTDPMDECFERGWLKDVYKIKPVGDSVRTRFPPEPNGFLHIGHAKAIAVNFGFAKHRGGKCFLRYDDTNPAKEEEMFFNSILEMVEWLGFKPYQVTYSSDHFQRLYDLAELMVQRDKAYVCHCSQEEMKKQRGGDDDKNKTARYACSHRDRPTAESLAEFRKMRDGQYPPKAALLRMKQDIVNNPNPQMWDMPAYRLPEQSFHHRTADKWRIYPTYDFTHCLCDAFEEISHSLCTTEFRTARESYSWLVEELADQLPTVPEQREYGRLNVTGTVLSKRKIEKLVTTGIVRSWDDPRLYTLASLRRRGVPPGAIRAFVADLGVSDATSQIQTVKLESVIRKYLERSVPRLFVLLEPLKLIIDDLPADHVEMLDVELLKGDPDMGSHRVPFTREIYIDASDFREEVSAGEDFRRLAPGRIVGLLHVPYPVRAKTVSKDAGGRISAVHCSCERPAEAGGKVEKPQAYVQWVAHSPAHNSPVKAEVRIFNPLFKSENPDAAEGGFLRDVNEHSEEVYPGAVAEVGLHEIVGSAPWPKDHIAKKAEAAGKPGPWDVRFQGVRIAYFAMDTESRPEEGKIVLNKIVGLKEDSGKK